jgi:prepilin signal peptidase PulO-like enzyme (type II secretory pathway)
MGWIANSFFTAVYFVLIALFIGCVFGIVFGLIVRLVRRRGGAFPFGPALALANVYVVMNFQRFLV